MLAVRAAVVVFAVVLLHLVERIHWVYFLMLGLAAAAMILQHWLTLPGLGFLKSLLRRDRLAVWIVLFCLALIGYLHTANQWVVDGLLLRPAQVGLWKTEMVLVIALAAPLAHSAASLCTTLIARVDGRHFANEFALYVNFSGIALALWTDDAAVSRNALAAVIVLVVLTQLTLYASLDDG